MTDINYTITFFSDWNCGSGLSAGPESDSLVKKNRDGLPYVPGKTIKGLLKDAARELFEEDTGFIESCFGNKAETRNESADYEFFYSNSEFTSGLTTYFKSNPMEKDKLFRTVPSTSIDENTGVAKNKSLRTMEVVIPLTLTGFISNIPDGYEEKMKDCLKMIKRLGTKRNRGLGRCRFDVFDQKKGD